jgi:hypothetical protein
VVKLQRDQDGPQCWRLNTYEALLTVLPVISKNRVGKAKQARRTNKEKAKNRRRLLAKSESLSACASYLRGRY